MDKKTVAISAAGWLLGVGLIGSALVGARLSGFPGIPGIASAGDGPRFEENAIVALAAGWAEGYVADTIGGQLGADGHRVTLAQMQLVDLRFVKDARQVLTSMESGSRWSEERDVWVLSWERSGVENITTGKADGTAYIALVVDDATGKILSATASLRQPEQQARARDPLPSYDEVFPAAQRDSLTQRSCPPYARKVIPLASGGTGFVCSASD